MRTAQVFYWLVLVGLALVLSAIVFITMVDKPLIGYTLLRAALLYAGLWGFGLFATFLWKFTGAVDARRADTTPQEFHETVNARARDLRTYARMILRRDK
ncbi:MAG: hypothetical protein ACE5FI_15970 [Anaerolineales bacterium]